MPPSLPMPLSLIPPKGLSAEFALAVFIATVPDCSLSEHLKALERLDVKT